MTIRPVVGTALLFSLRTLAAEDDHSLPDPYGVEVYRHVDFVGDSIAYRIEPGMRDPLDPRPSRMAE